MVSFNWETFERRYYALSSGKLPYVNINAVATNYDKVRWFGTGAGLVGLIDTARTTFSQATTPQLPSHIIIAIGYDLLGNLWIGTSHGVAVYNDLGTIF